MVLGLMGDWRQGIQSLLQSHLCLTHARNFMSRTVHCIKLEKEAEGLDFAPYPGELGKRIWENVSKDAWAAWLKHQTMLVNENRLNLADLRARQYPVGALCPQAAAVLHAARWPGAQHGAAHFSAGD